MGMATHSSILAWRIPWTEEPGGWWSTGWPSTHAMYMSNIYVYFLCIELLFIKIIYNYVINYIYYIYKIDVIYVPYIYILIIYNY